MNSKILICGMKYGSWHRSCSIVTQWRTDNQKLVNFGGDLITATETPMGRHRYAGRTLENI